MTSAYRDEMQPLRDELRGLEQRLAETRAQTERLAALQAGEASLENEIAELRRRVFAHETRRGLPMLDNVRIATPCKVPWDSMVGDDRIRHCTQCDKNVYNVAGMSREEAETLLTARSDSLCMRIFRRADGTVMTNDCPVGVKRRRRLVVLGAAGGLAAGFATAFGFASTATMGDVEMVGKMEVVQGGVMPMPPAEQPKVAPVPPQDDLAHPKDAPQTTQTPATTPASPVEIGPSAPSPR